MRPDRRKREKRAPDAGCRPRDDPNDRACLDVAALPAWMLSECSPLADEAASARSTYGLMATATNGDCLFHSVRLCLLSATRDPSRAPTSAQLREAVARTVLDPNDRAASAALTAWRDVLVAAPPSSDLLLRDYAHARALLDDWPPFASCTRRRVYEAMRRGGGTYWGDDYALAALERLTGIAIAVVARGGPDGRACRGQLGATERSASHRRWWAVLCLDGCHYRPLVRLRGNGPDGRLTYAAAFGDARSVPRFVRAAFAAVAAEAPNAEAERNARRLDPFGASAPPVRRHRALTAAR